MGTVKLNSYFHIFKANQPLTHQNMRLWHVRSRRSWTLVISRNLHKTSDVTTGFWGKAWPCCGWPRTVSCSPSRSPRLLSCFQ